MSSSKDIENYFAGMAKKNVPHTDMYYMKQRGRGIGKGKRNSSMYKISHSPSIAPVQQGIAQAKSEVAFSKAIKRKSRSKSSSVGRKRRRRSSSGKKKSGHRKKSSKNKKGHRKQSKKSSNKKRTKSRKKSKKKDIFS